MKNLLSVYLRICYTLQRAILHLGIETTTENGKSAIKYRTIKKR